MVFNVQFSDRRQATFKRLAIVVKKTHNLKNNVLSTPERRILWLSRTSEGSMHDKKICDNQPIHFPPGIKLWQDTGFLGHNPKNVKVMMSTKKPKGSELSDEQKESNRSISSFRVLVEHAIGGVKKISYCQRSL